jgi:hypothetical protein
LECQLGFGLLPELLPWVLAGLHQMLGRIREIQLKLQNHVLQNQLKIGIEIRNRLGHVEQWQQVFTRTAKQQAGNIVEQRQQQFCFGV